MGFQNRLKKVKDSDAPIPERVMALCDALTHCHAGFAGGKEELKQKFGWEIGQHINDDQLIRMADYLNDQWRSHGRSPLST